MPKNLNYDDEMEYNDMEFNYMYPPMFNCPYENFRVQPGAPMMPGMQPMMPNMQQMMPGGHMMPEEMQMEQPGTVPAQQNPQMPPNPIAPEEIPTEEPTIANVNYTQGYLKTQIGKRVKIDFLIGTNMLIDKGGILLEVGISYIVIRETATNIKIMADIYSIKFVEIYDK